MKNTIILIVLLAPVMLMASCNNQQASPEKISIKVSFENKEANRIIVRGFYNIWEKFDMYAKDENGELLIEKIIDEPEYIIITVPRESGSVKCFIEKGDSVNILVKEREVIFEGNSITARQNQLLQQITLEKKRLSAYDLSIRMYELRQKRNDSYEKPEEVTFDEIHSNIANMIEVFKASNKDYSKSFIKFVEIDNKYYKILRDLDMPNYKVKTYHPFSDTDLVKLEQAFEDANYKEAVYSTNYRQVLNAYIDYLRIEDPKNLLGEGKEYLLNEVRLADYVENPLIKEYILTGNLLALVFSEDKNPVYLETIEKYGGRWKDFLLQQAKAKKGKAGAKNTPAQEFPELQGVNPNGETISLKELQGKWLYVDIWATWCGPCNFEIPYLIELKKRLHDYPVEFIGISVDKEEDQEKWKDFLTEKGLGGNQMLCTDKQTVYSQFGVRGIPHFAIINPEGKLVYNNVARPSSGVPERLLKALSTQN